jgi:uncharacterized membrane protein YfcA
VQLTPLEYLAAAAAGGAAATINAVAGGGTLVSFSTLVGLGVPPVTANVTNTVSLVPAYLAGTWGQRHDLKPQLGRARILAVAAFSGGLVGSILLVTLPAAVFRQAAPYLILLACALLLAEDRLRQRLRPTRAGAGVGSTPDGRQLSGAAAASPWTPPAVVAVFAAAVYGGFFGAGLGIMLMAILGLFSADSLIQVNALKQALSFVINLVAAVFFVFSGHVSWALVPGMAVAGIFGGLFGSRVVRVIKPDQLRRVVVAIGVAVAIAFWVA